MIETIKIAKLAQEFMAKLEEEYLNYDVVEVGIVVELRKTNEEGQSEINTPTACSNDSRVYQTGLFQWGLDNVQWYGEEFDD